MTTDSEPVSELDLHAYVDAELGPARKRQVEAWLVEHPADAERVATWARQGEAIRAAYDPVLTEPDTAAIVAAARRLRLRPLANIAAAATVAFGLGLGAGLLALSFRHAPNDGLTGSGLAAHGVYTREQVHAVEVKAAEKPHLEAWLTNRVGAPVRAPELAGQGLELLGGRVVPALGRAGALLMYQSGSGDRFTLLVVGAEKGNSAGQYRQSGDFGAVTWVGDGYGYVLAGPPEPARLEAVRRAVVAGSPASL